MSNHVNIIIIVCILVMTTGQILFKKAALNYNKENTLWAPKTLGVLSLAAILYVMSTVLWVWALRYVDISKAYPYFSLGFVLVPLAGALFFKEQLTLKRVMGIVLIILGVTITGVSL